jgi:hypothetical protein
MLRLALRSFFNSTRAAANMCIDQLGLTSSHVKVKVHSLAHTGCLQGVHVALRQASLANKLHLHQHTHTHIHTHLQIKPVQWNIMCQDSKPTTTYMYRSRVHTTSEREKGCIPSSWLKE